MKRKLLTILLTLALVCTLLPVNSVQAAYWDSYTDTYPVTGGFLYFNAKTGEIVDSDESVTVVNIPRTINGVPVTCIGRDAFYACRSLKSMTIPDSVTSIEDGAFFGCSRLTRVMIPNSVTSIEGAVFGDCNSLKEIKVAVDNPNYTSDGIALFNKAKTEILQFPGGYAGGYKIPDSVMNIGNGAFSWCGSLTSVTIPNSVKIIDICAFFDCSGLTSVTIPNGVTSIGGEAFGDCSSLTCVTIPNSVTRIGAGAFDNCYNLKDVYYTGSAAKWNQIIIHDWNEVLQNARKHFDYQPSAAELKFGDVLPGIWYVDAVNWALKNGITNGVSDGQFKPGNNCTRGQIVTFLWRAKGSPKPKSTGTAFVDVPSNQYYYKAVLWAVENGITTGIDATHFKPNNICKRGQAVTFLWRTAGKPRPANSRNPFTDVPNNQFYHDAVLWAVEQNITTGTTATTFKPGNNCTRGHIVTFLYRDLA